MTTCVCVYVYILYIYNLPAGAPPKVGQAVGYFLGLFLSSNVKHIFNIIMSTLLYDNFVWVLQTFSFLILVL